MSNAEVADFESSDDDYDDYDTLRRPLGFKKSTGSQAHVKRMNFSFGFGGRRLYRRISVSKYSRLPVETRLRLAVGLVNSNVFAELYKDAGSKEDYLLKMINKEQADQLTKEAMLDLIGTETKLGHMAVNGTGPQLTELGFDVVLAAAKTIKGER